MKSWSQITDNVTGDTIQSIGPTPEEISIISEQEPLTGGLGNPIGLSQQLISDKMFYVSARKSNDGRITVQTALPFSGALSDSLRNEPSFWVIIALIALAFTAIAYFSTKFLSRSVRLLKTFADNIENNEGSLGNLPDFPTMSSATYRGASSTCIARKPMPTSGQTASTLWPSTPSRSEQNQTPTHQQSQPRAQDSHRSDQRLSRYHRCFARDGCRYKRPVHTPGLRQCGAPMLNARRYIDHHSSWRKDQTT